MNFWLATCTEQKGTFMAAQFNHINHYYTILLGSSAPFNFFNVNRRRQLVTPQTGMNLCMPRVSNMHVAGLTSFKEKSMCQVLFVQGSP